MGVFRLDLATARRDVLRDLIPSDPAGIILPPIPVITPDGKAYAYFVSYLRSDLYLVEGLK